VTSGLGFGALGYQGGGSGICLSGKERGAGSADRPVCATVCLSEFRRSARKR
jgi:hypothetical protein